MQKGVRVFAAGVLLIVLSSGAAFAASRDSQDVSLFERLLSWVLHSRWSPSIGAPASNSRLCPPIGSPTPNGRLSPPGGAPAPDPEPQPEGRLSPPIGVTDTSAATTT
jgi:hypothetical protein